MPPAEFWDVNALAEVVARKVAEHLRVEEDRLVDRKQLADRVGVSERTVGALVARQELPPPLLHTAGIARWDWGQVMKYLAERQGKARRRGRGRYQRVRPRTPDD